MCNAVAFGYHKSACEALIGSTEPIKIQIVVEKIPDRTYARLKSTKHPKRDKLFCVSVIIEQPFTLKSVELARNVKIAHRQKMKY